jgi:hypothetical protein
MKLDTVIFSNAANYGNCPGIRDALKLSQLLNPLDVVVKCKDPYQFHETCIVYGSRKAESLRLLRKADVVWLNGFVSIEPLNNLMKGVEDFLATKKLVIMFLTDTLYMVDYHQINKFLDKGFIDVVFAMPDLIRFSEHRKHISLYQPIKLIEPQRENVIVIGHSPGARVIRKSSYRKGTHVIKQVIRQLKKEFSFKYNVMMDLTNDQCQLAKAKCDIFIDKITDEATGLGKSGLEAVGAGCITLCSMKYSKYTDSLVPPVINIETGQDLFDRLHELLNDQPLRMKWQRKVMNWRHNISYEGFSKKVDNSIREVLL